MSNVDWRNRIGLYGCYFCGMAGIGFILPFLPKFLKEGGLSNEAISVVWTLAALSSLAQFPIGIWSDRLGRCKPFLVVAQVLLTLVTILLIRVEGVAWLGLLAILFAENGICRATIESLAGAEATRLAPPGGVARALAALRFWRPVAIVTVALGGGLVAERMGIAALLPPLAALQGLGVVFALLVHEKGLTTESTENTEEEHKQQRSCSVSSVSSVVKSVEERGKGLRDSLLWAFVLAMVLFHVANSPPGAYLGVFLDEDLHAPVNFLSSSFVVSMVAWMLAVTVVGRLADRVGRRPLLILGWVVMTVRLVLLSIVDNPWQVLAIQILDGLAQALFAILAATWVMDRLLDPARAGEAQVLVGCSLVLGSALGPALAGMVVGSLGYRGLFGLLAGIGAAATLLVVALIPETLTKPSSEISGRAQALQSPEGLRPAADLRPLTSGTPDS